MWALTVLSYDSDFSKKKSQKTIWLIEMHRMLLQALKDRLQAEEASLENKVSIALYFENLKRLPEKTKKLIVGETRLPRLKAPHPTKASPIHKLISIELRRKFTENKKDFIVVDEESGLESEILPMNITIKEGTENRIVAFIEIEGPYKFVTTEDGQRVSHRRDQLKEELYKFNHPGVPLLRIDLLYNRRIEDYVEELYEKVAIQ
jgi:hypothetical protein